MTAGLVEILAARAERPEMGAFRFLRDGELDEKKLSYGELEERSRAIAGLLQETMNVGERVLLLYAPGLEFITALFACLRSGIVAVPVYPPDPMRAERSFGRLRHVVDDCRPRAILTAEPIFERRQLLCSWCPELKPLTWIASDAAWQGNAGHYKPWKPKDESIALIQYTSGSTAAPKGVVLQHQQIIANQRLIRTSFRSEPDDIVCGWLPLYHDMGLLGQVLHSFYCGMEMVMMSPLHFLQQPMRWLRAITRYRATIGGGPSFGYELCLKWVRKREAVERAGNAIDLSSWKVAFNGAEPVRADILEEFSRTFAPCGFKREAFLPCYGLAEATLFVTGPTRQAGPTIVSFDREELERGRARVADGRITKTRTLVSSGPCVDLALGHELLVVDPGSCTPCEEGKIGEIWVCGPSIARRYWREADDLQHCFCATTSDGRSGFLRTGDLGFISGGELFVTGRLKELIIVCGRNVYPQDVELVAQSSHPALRHGGGAAISVVQDDGEKLMLVQEVSAQKDLHLDKVIEAIRLAVSRELQVQLSAVALVPPKTIPKTPSGKIQRRSVAASYKDARLQTLAMWPDSSNSSTI
jgi:acyl-CoA synthetase (AMP-forming)/AMP-acid ligase II